jgi:hypothetical protein
MREACPLRAHCGISDAILDPYINALTYLAAPEMMPPNVEQFKTRRTE